MPEDQLALAFPPDKIGHATVSTVLTGYIDENSLTAIENMAASMQKDRRIDIGYRANALPYWFGRHGLLKKQITDVFTEALKACPDIRTDIVNTVDTKNAFMGEDWTRFLLSCRCMLGCLGGSSILEPGVDYIEIKRDFSNIDDVLEKVRDKAYCEKIAQQCYDHVIRPGDADNPYTYRWFANHVVDYIEEHRGPTTDKEMTPAIRDYMEDRCAYYSSKAYLEPVVRRSKPLPLPIRLCCSFARLMWSGAGRAQIWAGIRKRLHKSSGK